MSYWSFWSGNLSLSSVMQMCSPYFCCQGETERWKMSLLTKFLCHWCVKNTAKPPKGQTHFRARSWLQPVLFLSCLSVYCSVFAWLFLQSPPPASASVAEVVCICISELSNFNIRPLLRQNTCERTGLSEGEDRWHEGWRGYRVLSYPPHLYWVIF